MPKFALLGWPVRHSVSPQMQGAAFRALGIPATYELVEVPPDDVGPTVRRLQTAGYAGWNVTVPHKRHILQFLDQVEAGARAAESVNTVVNAQGELTGHSTDGYGLATAVDESFGISVRGAAVAFLGAGGAVRATSVAFARDGARRIVLINRTLAKAESIARTINGLSESCSVSCLGLDDVQNAARALADVQVLIQGTSLGLHEADPVPLAPELLPPHLAVMDMIYRDTPFLAGARARGCATADGRGMLLHQGALSCELWTGQPAPVEEMRRALDAALAGRA